MSVTFCRFINQTAWKINPDLYSEPVDDQNFTLADDTVYNLIPGIKALHGNELESYLKNLDPEQQSFLAKCTELLNVLNEGNRQAYDSCFDAIVKQINRYRSNNLYLDFFEFMWREFAGKNNFDTTSFGSVYDMILGCLVDARAENPVVAQSLDPDAKSILYLALYLINDKLPNFWKREKSRTVLVKKIFVQLELLIKPLAERKECLHVVLQLIDNFLETTVIHGKDFGTQLLRSKKYYFCLDSLHYIVNDIIDKIEFFDHELYLRLKLKFANLPTPLPRPDFLHLHLTNSEQLQYLLQKLANKEASLTDKFVKLLSQASSDTARSDAKHVSKILSQRTPLSDANREKVRQVTPPKMTSEAVAILAKKLLRTAKVHSYFREQLTHNEGNLFIPTWYHATSSDGLSKILESFELRVFKKGAYRGAFVSCKREDAFGNYTLCLSNDLVRIDAFPLLVSEPSWKGLQRAIPLKPLAANGTGCLGLVGIPESLDKYAYKTTKSTLQKLLQSHGYERVTITSNAQLDFLARTVTRILGVPNLPDSWIGGDVFYGAYQLELHAQAKSLALASTFDVVARPIDQSIISKCIQQLALPFYKRVMPQYPSYQRQAGERRITLMQNYGYSRSLNDVSEKWSTARDLHGTMHAARVALWALVLVRLYQKLGRNVQVNHLLLAVMAAMHDAARENEGTDYWDSESAKLLAVLLKALKFPDDEIAKYSQAIREKDPTDLQFTSDIQRIMHDADCLDFMRLCGLVGFDRKQFFAYGVAGNNLIYVEQLLAEIARFIELTDDAGVRLCMEHESDDFYADLVHVLFALGSFSHLTDLLQADMQDILKTKENSTTRKVLAKLSGITQ